MGASSRRFATLKFFLLIGSIGALMGASPRALAKRAKSQSVTSPPTSLKQQAISEIDHSEKNETQNSSAVTVAPGMLSLKDPRPTILERSWRYTLGLAVQEFQPLGRAQNDLTNSQFDFSENGRTVLPGIEFGFLKSVGLSQAANWSVGLNGRAAYTSQKAEARFDTGFVESNVRLNSTLWSLAPQITVIANRLKWLSLNLGGEWGNIIYTQISSNELANLTKRAPYTALVLGSDFSLDENWSLTLRYARRKLTRSSDEIGLQADNLEVGTKIIW